MEEEKKGDCNMHLVKKRKGRMDNSIERRAKETKIKKVFYKHPRGREKD